MIIKNTTDRIIYLNNGYPFKPNESVEVDQKLADLLLDKYDMQVMNDADTTTKDTKLSTERKSGKKKK